MRRLVHHALILCLVLTGIGLGAVLGIAALRTGRIENVEGRRIAVVTTGRGIGLDALRSVLTG